MVLIGTKEKMMTPKEEKIIYTFGPFSNYLKRGKYSIKDTCSGCNQCGCGSCNGEDRPEPGCGGCGF